jgi:excisionase family DNA binding protein
MVRGTLTTGQAARLCGVTPDTVLKWVKAGKLCASRTPGGHCRIHPEDLAPFRAAPDKREARFCWEFNARLGRVSEECRKCLVYRARARRCFELAQLDESAGHARMFCHESCDDCDYLQQVRGQAANVLVMSDQADFGQDEKGDAPRVPFNICVTEIEYTLSEVVESFRPDYMVIDCALGIERALRIADFLLDDSRTALRRIILAAHPREYPDDLDKQVFLRIPRPLRIEKIIECVENLLDDD